MARFDQDSGECLVFTFKEGLLSPIAHDLKLRVSRFSIEVDDESHAVTATFDTGSLEVVTAMKDGRDNPSALSDKDRREIESNIHADVLHPTRHPEAVFRSTDVQKKSSGWEIAGELALHGKGRPLRTKATVEGDDLVVEVTLHQPDFGIKPYKAAFGTLKVQADVKVRLSVPVADL